MRGFGVVRRGCSDGGPGKVAGVLLGLLWWVAEAGDVLLGLLRRSVGGEYLGRGQVEAAGVRHRGGPRCRGGAFGPRWYGGGGRLGRRVTGVGRRRRRRRGSGVGLREPVIGSLSCGGA